MFARQKSHFLPGNDPFQTDPNSNIDIGRVDFHAHSTASDGDLTPSELVEAALAAGLAGLALTDHDTVDGLPEFMEAAARRGLKAFGGVEISLEHSGTMHLLGLNVNGGPEIPAALGSLKTFRVERNLKMQDRLGEMGYRLPWDQLLAKARGGQMGRPHFASLLMEKGYFKSREEVFDKLLGKGRPGYVDKKRLSPAEGLAMLRRAGWAPVLAHPVSLGLEADQWAAYIEYMADMGLVGLETRHPSLNQEQTEFFQGLARRFNLVETAGSDFHNRCKPLAGLEWVRGNSPLGWEMLEGLRERMAVTENVSGF
ncbi:PHP domain-containing protein [Deltaproteobacteria bacterium OttesenSCG-928-M10]|nr:PHP domain-containing protein [Deltaproteobacteria bacterium OttesenSCG-928-M10]